MITQIDWLIEGYILKITYSDHNRLTARNHAFCCEEINDLINNCQTDQPIHVLIDATNVIGIEDNMEDVVQASSCLATQPLLGEIIFYGNERSPVLVYADLLRVTLALKSRIFRTFSDAVNYLYGYETSMSKSLAAIA